MNRKKSSLWTAFKNEFKMENFSLNFEKNSEFLKNDPEQILEMFHSAIWPCCNRLFYVIYRVSIAFYYTIWFIESIVRNAEFRSKNYKISNRDKTNIFSLHPWPFYMTSWSLTILFIHLWITAFIALYFYSLSKKSCLASFFSHVFGPFSCSRQIRQEPKHCNTNASLFRKIARRFCKPDPQILETSRGLNQSSKPIYLIEKSDGESSKTPKPTNQTVEITVPLMSKENGGAQNADNSKECRVELTDNETNNAASNIECRTYCNNKDQCNLPSSRVKSDPATWQLWIDTHVPCPILCVIKISWLLYNIVVISAIVVTVVYFTYVLLFDLQVEPSWVQEIGNLHRHAINSIVAIVDILLFAYPVRIFHFVYCNLYGWLYAFVTFLYWFQDPKEHIVYEQIDYGQPLKIIGFYVCLNVLVFVLQTVHFLAYRLKVYLKEKYSTERCE